MKLPVLSLLAVLCGCAGDGDSPARSAHPANADAAETPWAPPPDRLANPVEPKPEEKAPPKESGTWICPMHTEVVQDHPGTCPRCKMDLEPAIWVCSMHPAVKSDKSGKCPTCGMQLVPVIPEDDPK